MILRSPSLRVRCNNTEWPGQDPQPVRAVSAAPCTGTDSRRRTHPPSGRLETIDMPLISNINLVSGPFPAVVAVLAFVSVAVLLHLRRRWILEVAGAAVLAAILAWVINWYMVNVAGLSVYDLPLQGSSNSAPSVQSAASASAVTVRPVTSNPLPSTGTNPA